MGQQCRGGRRRYGNLVDERELRANLRSNCIPLGLELMTVDDYPRFLSERRRLMATKIREYFASL
jgi:hypothetical protein